MNRFLLSAALLASTTALATGERVSLLPASNPMKETLCVSMDCATSSRPEATVAARPVKNGVEFSVTMATGQRRLTHVVPTRPDGSLSSTDLVRATALVLKAIEEGPVKGDQPVATAARKPLKRAKAKLLAHR